MNLDTAIFERSGFARFDLAGTWLVTNSLGETRHVVFDENGDLVSFELPSDEVFEVTDGDTVDILLTSFGAFSLHVHGSTEQAGHVIIVHDFEGLFSDDGTRIRGTAENAAANLSASRSCDCSETWIREVE